ncbi:MAG: hypothetical protein QM601_07240 [Pseudoxanthomonas sp.]
MIVPMALRGDGRRKTLDALLEQREALIVARAQVSEAVLPADELRTVLRAELVAASPLASRTKAMRNAGRQRAGRIAPTLGADKSLTLADLAAVLGPEEVIDRLLALAYLDSDAETLSTAERSKRLRELDAKIHEIEIAEEREVLRLFDAGVIALRRDTADPSLLLDVWQEGHAVGREDSPKSKPAPYLSPEEMARAPILNG